MVRKCSHCGHNGHNSRTCCSSTRGGMAGGGGVKLFGVQLHLASPLKKSFSMDCLSCAYPFAPSSSPSSSTSSLGSVDEAAEKMANGCLSDGPGGRKQERKKGLSWTEEEHRQFLAGLEKLGKGDWRGISRNFVTTRTPTQVASHAQKYFLRQSSLNKKKRRSSLFDVVSTCEKAAHRSDSSKLGEEVHGPVLSPCTMARQTIPETAKIDLNSSIQEQETTDHLPSSVGPDLELRISSSRLNQKISSPGIRISVLVP